MDKLEKAGEAVLKFTIAFAILFVAFALMPKEKELEVSALKPKYEPAPGIIEKSCKETGIHCRDLANHVDWGN